MPSWINFTSGAPNHCPSRPPIFLLLLLVALGWASPSAAPGADLDQGFQRPPESARAWVYWFVMDGNFSREGITADFEALKRAGIGGVSMMEVDVGIPRGTVKFMGPEWRALFKHAVAEAERLGLQITLNAGPGWTGSGGPWVKPEESMQHLVASAVEVAGPKRFDEMLPRPQRRPAFFGDGQLPAELEKAKNDFYRDEIVLAFPTPAGNERISDIDEKALYVRAPYSSQPKVKPFLPTSASYPALPSEAVIAADRVLDISERMGPDGRLAWDVPAGRWTIMRFGRTSTGACTRPAPLPGLGLESDKMDPAALEAHFNAFVGVLLREIGPRKQSAESGWTMLHIDSWEMGAQNWTAAFRDEFRRRRGYDPARYLPAVTGRVVDSLEVTERFLWDVRQTAQELVIQNHAERLKELGRRHGFGLSIEPYDMMPCSDMSFGAVADVPMCEFWLHGFDTTYSVIEAASVAHTCGKQIVAAEAFTSDDTERWQAYPGAMKILGDWAFSSGVNRIVFHRYQHQPQLDARPGMTMGPYGVHWERTQTWWDMAGAYHEYLARCQFMLRQGLPVADVCFLVPEGSPHVFRPPSSARIGQPPDRPGYNYDGCAPETLMSRMSVAADGRLVLPDGMSYRVLVLPEMPTMTPALLRKVRDLVKAGATVVGSPPLKSPSLSGYPQCDDEVQKLAAELWGDGSGAPRLQGRVIREAGKNAARSGKSPEPIKLSKWIWHHEGNPADSAPVGSRYFRRSFNLDGKGDVESGRVYMTADNSFALWVNGRPAGKGNNFHAVSVLDVTQMLRPGENILAVAAENGGTAPNPAGLTGALVVKFRDGHVFTVLTDKTWHAAQDTQGKWATARVAAGHWTGAMELGPAGMAPWGEVGLPAVEPEQFCDFTVVSAVLSELGVRPDFESDAPLRYTHRQTRDADIYFVANREERPVETSCIFRVAGKAPELWDPLTGQTRTLPEFTVRDGRTTVPMRFEPAQSFFVVFRKTEGSAGGRNFPRESKVADLPGSWNVAFDPKWGGPQNVVFDRLQDWSKRKEDGIRYYSGTAIYRKSFDAPKSVRGQRMHLDLGAVKNLAAVRLNGRDLGVVWCAPWRVDITDSAKVKGNQLEITVANLWPNRLIGDQSLPPEQRLTSTTWNPFKKDSPLLESGLLGPVSLVAVEGASAAEPKRKRADAQTGHTQTADCAIVEHPGSRLVTLADARSNLVLRLNYNGRCLLDRVIVRSREVIAPETGVCSAIQVSNHWFTTRSGIPAPKVAVSRNKVTVREIVFGGMGIQVTENWEFTVHPDRILWQISRNYGMAGRLEDSYCPGWDFRDMNTWTGGLLDTGGVVWNKYLETSNATYGAHASAVTFWNRDDGACLRIKSEAGASRPPPHLAMRFSHQPSGIQTASFSVTDSELKPRHDLRRFHPSRQDLWAPYEVKPDQLTVTYSLQSLDYGKAFDRGSFQGLNGKSIRDLLNTIGRYGVIDRRILGANGWRTGFTCLHEQWFSQMGIAIDDPDYLANCAATFDFERDHAIEPSGRVKSRWCCLAHDAMPGTYDANGYYEAQWGYLLDSQPCYVICVAELFDLTGDQEWLRGQKSACERALDYLLRRDADGDGLVEMMTDSHKQERGSDWIDVIWAAHENALVNAELYYALLLWADAEEVLGDDARAADYRRCAAKLKVNFNRTAAEGGFWDPQNQWYAYWREKDGSIHGNNLVTPVQFTAIGYGLCDDAERREAILRRIEKEMRNENLFFWPLNFFPYQPGEGHATVNFPFPNYENGDIFLSWGELAVRAYAKSDPAIAVKYIRNVLDRYEADGLSFQRYERKSQRGAGEDILAGNCMPVVGLYRNIYGLQPKHDRIYLEPHLTPELSGTRLRYQLRNQSYLIDLTTAATRVEVEDFAVRSAQPFALSAKGDTAQLFPGKSGGPAMTLSRSRRAPVEIELDTRLADMASERKWIVSSGSAGVVIWHVVSHLTPHAKYELRRENHKVGSFKADGGGQVEFKCEFDATEPQHFELLQQ
ncbi:MAG TPA: glycosyl hydrolase [Candidatus Paceibacterota bacterium]|nr:glycosyl hydrolase [Verrucomicrobiota bacterium]HSA11242.1 glycosyl hydrolase [Candidatus Paceibacterota bacterium]